MEVLKEGTGYLGTFFRGDYGDDYRKEDVRRPICTLLVRHYQLRRTPKGNLTVKIDMDAREFPDEDAMVSTIEDAGWFELPSEADGNPQYVPPEFDPKVLQPA